LLKKAELVNYTNTLFPHNSEEERKRELKYVAERNPEEVVTSGVRTTWSFYTQFYFPNTTFPIILTDKSGQDCIASKFPRNQ